MRVQDPDRLTSGAQWPDRQVIVTGARPELSR